MPSRTKISIMHPAMPPRIQIQRWHTSSREWALLGREAVVEAGWLAAAEGASDARMLPGTEAVLAPVGRPPRLRCGPPNRESMSESLSERRE